MPSVTIQGLLIKYSEGMGEPTRTHREENTDVLTWENAHSTLTIVSGEPTECVLRGKGSFQVFRQSDELLHLAQTQATAVLNWLNSNGEKANPLVRDIVNGPHKGQD